MRGLWKPFALYAGGAALVLAGLGLTGLGVPWPLSAVAWLAMMPFVAVVAGLGPYRAGRFVRGLRDAGELVEIESDAFDGWGDRRIAVRGVSGTWLVVGVGGKAARVEVQGPGDDAPWRVSGNERRAAADAVARVAVGGRAEPPPFLATPRRLVLYVVVFYFAFAFIGFVLGGVKGAAWTGAVTLPLFAWLAWKVLSRGKVVAQYATGRVGDP